MTLLPKLLAVLQQQHALPAPYPHRPVGVVLCETIDQKAGAVNIGYHDL